MSRTKPDEKDKWERERVQRVLDCHNKKYGTNIEIKGKSADVYPDLKGELNWDWVCYDTKTGDEIAIEDKRLTDPKLEEKGNIIWQLLEEVRDSLSNPQKLSGTFYLYVDFPKDYYLPFNEQSNKREFKNLLYEAIYKTAQRLKLGEKEDLKPKIIGQLLFSLPDRFLCCLYKFGDEGSVIGLGSGSTGWSSRELDEHELKEFETLVSHANTQLSQANVKETFLVIIEEGRRITYPDTVSDALKRINRADYSHINHIYYVSGEEVKEVS